jgi:hypothetical protein
MDYKNKLNKYRYKILFKKQIGGRDCDTRHTEDVLSTTYIKDTSDFIPFQKSSLHRFRNHPKCSYSMWDMNHINLYVPVAPKLKDKLYSNQPFYIRLHNAYFKSQVKGEDVGTELHAIMWSNVHKKWYELDNWPLNDNLLNELFTFLHVDDALSAKMVINNLYLFRKEYQNNPESIAENVKIINDLLINNEGGPSEEVLSELERYSPTPPPEIVGEDFEEEPVRFE